MDFGLDKYTKATFKAENFIKAKNTELDNTLAIRSLDNSTLYKNLRTNESNSIQHSGMKENIWKEYNRRVRMVLNSQLNAAYRMNMILSLTIPLTKYSFGIIMWNFPDTHGYGGKDL